MTAKQKILIVDDKRENLVALRQVLSDVDVEIVEATNGNEALAATLNHDFAVAILDIRMPGMSGFELAKHLRGDKKTKVIPLVFLTASFPDEQSAFKGYEAGAIDYIVKPYASEVILGKVKVFLEMDRNRLELQRYRDHLETLVTERTAQLAERVREVQCLYAISSLVAEPCESIDESLKVAADLIPAGWKYSEIACARILFEGREFATANFKETAWKQSADMVLSGGKYGAVEVCYLEEKPEADEGPFLNEERELITGIARQIGLMVVRGRAQHELEASEARYRHLFESAKDGILILNADNGTIMDVNPFLVNLLGYTKEEFLGKQLWEIGTLKDLLANKVAFLELVEKGYVRHEHLPLQTKDGRVIEVEFVSNVYQADAIKVIQCNIRDISERRMLEKRAELTAQVLVTLNRTNDITKLVADILQQIKQSTHMEAVGIRLHEGDDYPYFETNGFPENFLKDEQSLCAQNAKGECLRDTDGSPVLECMCGNVLRGQTDPTLPFFTEGGSFWSNNNTKLLATSTEAERSARTPYRCNSEGYESVSLIPLRSGDEIIGLLQFNDHQPDRFNLEMITFYEKLGASIGIAIRRKQNTEALKDSEIQYRTLVDNLPQKVFLKDRNSVYVSCNRRFADELGIALNDFQGRTDYDFFPSELAEKYLEDDRRIMAAGLTEEIEEKYVLSGQESWVHTVKAPVKNESDEITGILGIFWDVTGLKRAQEDIAELARFPNENANPVLRVSREGTILYGNAASVPLLEFWNCSEGQRLPAVWQTTITDALAADQVKTMEVACTERLFTISLVPISSSGYVNIYGLDITEHKRTEKLLRQSEKMQAIGQLAGGVAHEFNNQLAVINGFSELMLSKCDDNGFCTKLEHILKAGQRAAELTSSLLAYSRSDEVETTVFTVNYVLTELRPMLEQVIGEDISICEDLGPDVGQINLNRGQFTDMIFNLAANGRDAMPQGGVLTIHSANVVVAEQDQGELELEPGTYVSVTVQDTGTGMSDAIKAHITEPFFTTKAAGRGAGLGLSMVFGVVKKAGGGLKVDTEPGKGTSISILVPAAREIGLELAEDKQDESIQLGGDETILLVEDESGVREFLEAALKDLGYSVFSANGAEEAFQILDGLETPPQLVLADVVMPGMNGPDLVRKLRQEYRDIKVAYMSGYNRELLQERGKPEPGIRILRKPINLERLAREVRAALDE